MPRNFLALTTVFLITAPGLLAADTLAERATRSLGSCVAAYEAACTASAQAPEQCLMTGLQTCQVLHSGAVTEVTDTMLQIREIARGGGFTYRTALTTPSNRLTSGGGGGASGGSGPSGPSSNVQEIAIERNEPQGGGGLSIDRDSYSATVPGL